MKKELPQKIRAVIEPYLPKIFEWFNKGIQNYVSNDSGRNQVFEKRTSAGMIRDYIKHEVIKGTSDDKNIFCVKKGNLFLFVIDQKYALKIKKLNSNKKSVGAATDQLKLFLNNKMEIPGLMEKPKCMEAGYVVNEFWSGHEGIFITCRSEEWCFELSDGAQIKQLPIRKEEKKNKKRVKVKPTKIIQLNARKG
jgi:hypothetical protein